jgi:actinin alpha
MSATDKLWEKTQKKTFTAWVNSHLRKVGTSIEEISTDFSDGLKLAQLLQVISGDKVEKLTQKPTLRIQKIQNTGACLKLIQDKGVKLVGIAPEELVDGNLKMVLGMIWTIILRFQIQDISIEELSAKEGLLLWCQRKTEGYAHVKVTNFHTSFQDGLAFCALIHRHRPDLLDFSKLDPADKAGNLQLAFDIAEKHLDIPKMLDVSDMLDVPKPDERSVMTYIAAYFHVFSASQKAETAAKRVDKVLEFTEQVNQAKTDYVERAMKLTEWIQEATTRMEDRNFPQDIDGLQKLLDDFKEFKSTEKPPKAKDLTELEAAYNSIQTKLRINNRPPFVAPEGTSPEDIDRLWNKLEKAEQERAEALRSALRRQRKIDYLLEKYNVKLRRLGQWAAQEENYFKNTPLGQTLNVIRAQLKNLDAFHSEYETVGNKFEQDTNEILAGLEELGYNDMDTLRQRKTDLVQGAWANVKTSADQRKADLEEAKKRLQQIEDLLLDFAKRSSAFIVWLEGTEEQLTDPIVVESVEAVNDLQKDLDNLSAQVAEKSGEVEAIGALASQIQGLGSDEKTYAKFSHQEVAAKWAEFSSQIEARRGKLAAELQTQQANEELRVQFADLAKTFSEWIAEQTNVVSSATGAGSLEEQLQKARENAGVVQSNAHRWDDAVALNQKLDDARVTDNKHTELTIEVLKLKWDKLSLLARDTEDVIQKEIFAKSNSDLSPEELKELRDCFDHFDKDHSGALGKLELDACLKSLGEDLKEEALLNVLNDYGTNSQIPFDKFVDFMLKSRKGSDSPDNIKSSFRIMAEDKPFITEAQLRAVLPPARVDYLLENMPAYEGEAGGYDYVKFTDQLYAQ